MILTQKINEIDGWAEIGKDTSLGYGYVGWQHLHFPNQPFPDTEETYGGLATHFTGTPSVFIAHDEKLGSGTYWEGSVEANKEWKNGTNLKLKLIGAYNDDYYLEGSAPSHVGATATITLPASKNCSLEASIESIEGLREDVDSTTTLDGSEVEMVEEKKQPSYEDYLKGTERFFESTAEKEKYYVHLLEKTTMHVPSSFTQEYFLQNIFRHRFFTREIPITEGEEFLEIGCGTGVTSIFAVLRGAKHVTATDINPLAVANTRENGNFTDWKTKLLF